MRLLPLAMIALTACAEDAPREPLERLQGHWRVEAMRCARELTFRGVQLEAALICELADGSYGAQVETGLFSVDDALIQWEITDSTCLEAQLRTLDSRTSSRTVGWTCS